MASAVKPKSPWRKEYMFLNDPRIEAGRMRPAQFNIDDLVLTCVMIAGGLQDLVMGVLFWVSPNWSLEHMYSHDSTAINALTVALFEERGAALIEAGIAALLVATYRALRWYKGEPFNGIVYQITFFVNTVGRSLILAQDFPNSNTDMDTGFYMLVGRLSLSGCALFVSLWSFKSKWAWLFN